MPRRPDTFDRYVDRENAQAPLVQLSRGLGITQETEDIVGEATLAIQRVFEVSDLPEDIRLTLQQLIATNITPYLRKPVDHKSALSMLDIRTLGITEDHHIIRFLRNFGIDVHNEKDFEYLRATMKRAIKYFDTNIATTDDKQSKLNPELKKTDLEGILEVFKIASGKGKGSEFRTLIPKACGLLRIAAVIDFLNRDPVIQMVPHAEEKLKIILDKYFRSTNRKGTSKIWTFSPNPGTIINIERLEQRTKDPDRQITKALHKPSNRAEEVIDHIGFRVCTESASDTLNLIYQMFFLPESAILPGITIRIGESKNMILDREKLMDIIKNPEKATEFVASLSEETVDHEELTTTFGAKDATNPNSSKFYRAIHVTFDLPLDIETIGPKGEIRIVRDSFPVEVQFFDIKSKTQSEKEAPHGSYVARQANEVRKRVIGSNNLYTDFNNLSADELEALE